MHAKAKGSLGELLVAAKLIEEGCYVFTELGDLSAVDLIALVDDKPVKIQVKAAMSSKGKVHIRADKAGPNYRFTYTTKMIDVFAILVLDTKQIFFASAIEVLAQNDFTLRLDKPKNGQKSGIRFGKDYAEFRKALRDCTLRTLTDKAEGEETVQTAKKETSASES